MSVSTKIEYDEYMPRVVAMSAEDAKRFFGRDDEPIDLGPPMAAEKYKPDARVFAFRRSDV